VKSRCITFTENYYAVLTSSVFYIRLPSTMAWVSNYRIPYQNPDENVALSGGGGGGGGGGQ
jgi:hypothetical protein